MRAAISLLVLLVCMCGAQTRSTQTEVQTESQSTGAAAAAAEVSTQLDVSTELKELRNIRDMVVELRGALRYIQDTIKTMEGENSAVNNRLGVSEKEFEALSTRLSASEAEVMSLKKQRKAQSADLRSVAEKLVASKSELQNVEKISETAKVAFSAGLPTGYTEAVGRELDLVFSEVVTNVGQTYNSCTGYFTAPVRGLYYFTFTVRDDLDTRDMYIMICKNKQRIMELNEYDDDGYHTYLTGGVTLQLEVNDVVNLKIPAGSRLYNDVNNHSTFTGFLAFPL